MKAQYLFPCFFGESNIALDNNSLLDFCYSLDHDSGHTVSNVGGFQSGNLNLNDSNLQELVRGIYNSSNALLLDLQIQNKIVLTDLWCNINRTNCYNNAHSHAAFISGVYYLQTNENSGDIVFRHPSPLHPYFMKDIDVKFYHPTIANEWAFSPKSGDLYLFPSYLEHYVLPNRSDSDRISFAFNLNLG